MIISRRAWNELQAERQRLASEAFNAQTTRLLVESELQVLESNIRESLEIIARHLSRIPPVRP